MIMDDGASGTPEDPSDWEHGQDDIRKRHEAHGLRSTDGQAESEPSAERYRLAQLEMPPSQGAHGRADKTAERAQTGPESEQLPGAFEHVMRAVEHAIEDVRTDEAQYENPRDDGP
jgi:hypothetical protein